MTTIAVFLPLHGIDSIVISLQEKVRRNDTWSLLSSAAGASPRSREMVWEFVKENWALFDERYKDNILLERIVQVCTYQVHVHMNNTHVHAHCIGKLSDTDDSVELFEECTVICTSMHYMHVHVAHRCISEE